MLNVCFGDSEAAALRFALHGLQEEVCRSYERLDLGKISIDNMENARWQWMNEFDAPNGDIKKWWTDTKSCYHRILDTAKAEKELRIWYASSPDSRCGMYQIVYDLRDVDCKIFVVEMPDDVGYRRAPEDKCWSEANPYEMRDCLSLERELNQEEKIFYAGEWERLSQENAELRLNIDGKIASVSIDYLDDEILTHVPKSKSIKFPRVIGSMLGASRHAICDSFVVSRVYAMIEEGRIEITEGSMDDYFAHISVRRARM